MKKNFIYAICASILLMLSSCSGSNDPLPQLEVPKSEKGLIEKTITGNVEMKPNAVYVRKDITSQIVSNTDNTLIFKDTKSLDIIKEGDVLYSSGFDAGQPAFAKKVTNVTRANGQVVCQVRQAMIDEVFDSFDQKSNLKVSPSEIITYDVESQIKGEVSPDNAIPNSLESTLSRAFKISNKRVEIEAGLTSFSVKMLLYDMDDNLDTEHDQLHVKMNFDTDNMESHIGFKNGTLSVEGEWNSKVVLELLYGGYSLQNNDVLEALKKNKGAEDTYSKFLEKIQKKRIKCASIPTPWSIGSGKLKAGVTLDLYLLFECDLKGKFSLSVEYAPITLNYMVKVGKENDFKVRFCDPEKPKFQNFKAVGEIKAEGKLGVCVGIVFNLPAFPNPTDESKTSYLGVFVDIYFGFSAKMETSFALDPSVYTDAAGHIFAHLDMNLYSMPYFKSKLYFSFIKDFEIEKTVDFYDKPYAILKDPIEVDLGWVFMQAGGVHKISSENWNNDNNISVVEEGGQVASFKYDKEDFVFTGLKEGKSFFSVVFPQRPFKFGFFWINVYPNSKYNDIDNIENSKGELL